MDLVEMSGGGGGGGGRHGPSPGDMEKMREMMESEMKRMMDRVDTDRSGTVSMDEACKDNPEPPDDIEECEEGFEMVDRDGSGEVDFEEMMEFAMEEAMREMHGGHHEDHGDHHEDRGGGIGREEVEMLIQAADKNRDKALTRKE